MINRKHNSAAIIKHLVNNENTKLIMMEGCLRYQIVSFIINDKHRGEYYICDASPELLNTIATRAQSHFENKMDLFRLFQYRSPPKPGAPRT